MSQSVKDAIAIWSAPAMLAVILVLAGFIFNAQQGRIGDLETKLADNQNTLAVITANQVTSREDRVAFQDGVERRLGKMEDAIGSIDKTLARLAALQEREAP